MATMTQTISPSKQYGQGTVTTTVESRMPPRQRLERGRGMTVQKGDDGNLLLVFGPLFKWIAGILSALIVAAIVAIVTMAMSVSAFSRDLQYMQQDLVALKSSLLQMASDRYTGNQAALDRAAVLDLVKTNSADLSIMQRDIVLMRERMSSLESDIKNGKDK